MATSRPVPWLELILGGGLALWITLIVLIQLGLPPLNAVLWLITISIALVGTAIIVIGRERTYGKTILIVAGAIALILIFTTTSVQEQVIPFCGDGACSARECASGCADCDPELCRNGACEPETERCDTSADCACPSNLACAPERITSNPDLLGCVEPVCGDTICDAPAESKSNCCKDCGCANGYACLQNLCYFTPPQVGTTEYTLTDRISALSLAANPTLTTADGIPHSFAAITLNVEKSEARNVTVTFDLPDIAHYVVRLGDVAVGTETTVPWQMTPESIESQPLAVVEDRLANLTITLTYYDGLGVRHSRTSQYPIVIMSRETIDEYGHRAFLVTPNDMPNMGTTPHAIWESLGNRLEVIAGPSDHVRFPIETLTSKQGTREDIAVVLASALERANLNPALVDSAEGTLVRVRDGNRAIMLDPALIDLPYEEGIATRPGFSVDDVTDTWIARNATAPLHLSAALVPGALIRTELNADITCGQNGPKAISITTVHNDGLVPVSVCITTNVWRANTNLDARIGCITIGAQTQKEVRHSWQGAGACDIATLKVTSTYAVQQS